MEKYYELKNGRRIMSEELSAKMEIISKFKPESYSLDSTGFEWEDFGMANLFGEIYQNEARYCPEHKSWYTYDGGVWKKDTGELLVAEKMKEFIRLLNLYCIEIEDEEKQSKFSKFILRIRNHKCRENILKDARSELRIEAVEFDRNPYLINCLNGTYDLQTCTFKQHDCRDFITQQTRFNHTVSRNVKSERWEKFIREVCQDNNDKIGFLQRALGYSMLGRSNEECMFILHGKTTRNGKSTLLNTIHYLLGDYAKVAPVGLICGSGHSKDAEAASPTLAGLKGKRFVTMAESNEYGKLDEEKIKQLTGGEEISARALYQSAITYLPQFTLWLSCNDLPAVTDKSLFASERIKVIEFNRHFTPEEQDTRLKEELCSQENMSGIFMWLVRGYIKYKEKGLTMSKSMQSVVNEYAAANDVVLQFLQNRCEYCPASEFNPTNIRDKQITIRAKDLYQAFKNWARAEGACILPVRKFNSEMERHPEWFDKKSTSGGYTIYWGLKMKEIM